MRTFKVDRRLDGVVSIVTGSSSGIGLCTVRQLYRAGAQVFMACRNETKTRAVIQSLQEEATSGSGAAETKGTAGPGTLEFLPLDTSDLDSVRKCAQCFLDKRVPLHLLVNNAGIGGSADQGRSKQGFQNTFATNHLGHFLLTTLLQDKLVETAKSLESSATPPALPWVRVVNVSSSAHGMTSAVPLDRVAPTTADKDLVSGSEAYAVSKLATVQFTAELARRWKDETAGLPKNMQTFSLNPGVVATDIWNKRSWLVQRFVKLFMRDEEQGAYTTLYTCLSPEISQLSGEYFDDCQLGTRSKAGRDMQAAKLLWDASVQWTASSVSPK